MPLPFAQLFIGFGMRAVMQSQEGMIPRNVSLAKEAANAGTTWYTGFATTPGASA